MCQLMVIVGAGLILVMAAVFITFAATHLSVLQTARRVNTLEAENVNLRDEVARIDELAQELEYLSAQRAQILNMLGGEDLGAELESAMAAEPLPPLDEPLSDVELVQQLFANGARRSFAPRTWPASGPVRREYIPEAEEGYAAHPGLSIEVMEGDPVRAAGRGRIVEAGLSEYGEPSLVLDHGYGFRTVYAGFARPLVRVGQIVERQQPIAEFDGAGPAPRDRAGRIDEPTLYFEIQVDGMPIDPRNYLTPRQGRRSGS
jgi:septal ring factor EnvC (AmiA/AmiB activator)